ncbi:MAG: hypothetical protein ACJ79K_03240 [Gemmatimonadaceae bacterium]
MPELNPARRRITTRALALSSVALLLANVIACGDRGGDGPDVRGNGLRAAPLDNRARAAVYDAALRQAFDVDSALVLLVDPAILPRNGTFARDAKLDDDVVAELQRSGITRGTCETTEDTRHAPKCTAAGPGYVVRFSDVFQAKGDTVRVFVAAQRFHTTSGLGPTSRFAFESGFEIVRQGSGWRVAREGRRVAK